MTLRDGSIAAIRPAEQTGEAAWLALPGFVNLHAHADRAYTVQSFRPRSLADAVAAAAAARALFTAADVAARATRLFERSVEHGVTRIRTHTDVDPVVELRSMEGVLAAKAADGGHGSTSMSSRSRPRRTIWPNRARSTPQACRRDGRRSDRRQPQCQRRSARARSRRCSIWRSSPGCRSISTSTSISSRTACSRAWSPMR